MKRIFLSNISAKATVYVMVLLAAAVLAAYSAALHTMNEEVRESIIRRAESLGRSIASASGYHLILNDLLALDNMVFKVKAANPDITSISVIGAGGEVIVHSDPAKTGRRLADTAAARPEADPGDGTVLYGAGREAGRVLAVESPISFLEKDLGRVRLELDWSVLYNARAQARRRILPLFAAILALGFVSSMLLSRRVTRPVRELASGVEEMKRGGRTKPLRVYSMDELGRLTASFNEMTALITEQKEKLGSYARELEEAYVSTVRILAAAIEARDRYTLGHSTRVAELAVTLAREAGLPREEVETTEIACLFHDVGKIRIPDAILHKRGRLDPEEFREMKRHAEYGAELLSKAPSLYKYIPAVRHHHEWYDGSGYPDGLSRDRIPKVAAIISLADAFDAMTSDRPYRRALSREEALDIIARNSGRQFHPELTAVFLRLMKKRKASGPQAEQRA
jgi:putative nucleotidyltransferase with HDIG domain